MKKIWKIVYIIWPPVLRLLEKLKFHRGRQPWVLGFLKKHHKIDHVKSHLKNHGFEESILTWRDDGEILNMRKVVNHKYQYHVRVFHDYEIRAHYEYSSEGAPIKHCLEECFVPEREYFTDLLRDHLAV